MGTSPLNRGTNRPITLCTLKLFIQLMYNKNDHLAKWSIFCQIFDVFFRLYNPFPPLDPRRPLHILYICIATFNCPKGILGLGGKASKNKLKDASFIFSMVGWFGFVALRPKSTAMVIAGRSVHLTTLFPGQA